MISCWSVSNIYQRKMRLRRREMLQDSNGDTPVLRTNIDINEELVERAKKKLTGIKTKRAFVHNALRTLIFVREQAEVRRLRGKL